jgi:hypothetical protein
MDSSKDSRVIKAKHALDAAKIEYILKKIDRSIVTSEGYDKATPQEMEQKRIARDDAKMNLKLAEKNYIDSCQNITSDDIAGRLHILALPLNDTSIPLTHEQRLTELCSL